jgi:hypothetical protein
VGTFVTAVPARTAKLAAFPRVGDVTAYAGVIKAGVKTAREMEINSTAINVIILLAIFIKYLSSFVLLGILSFVSSAFVP